MTFNAENRQTHLTDMDFIRTWESCESMEEVAEIADVKLESVRRRARNMRMFGVPLRILPKYKNPVRRASNVKDEAYWLNIAKEYAKLQQETKNDGLSAKQLKLQNMEDKSDP
jgi:hypothetical protein